MTFDDVAAAIDYLASLDDDRLDLDDVTLIGHSAGGHLALWAASRPDSAVRFERVIAQAPITNLSATEAARELMGGTAEQYPERYAEADPMLRLPLGIPTLLVHGHDDMTIPVQRSREYVAAAQATGDNVELVESSVCGHRSHIDPRSPAWRAATEWLTAARSSSQPSVR
jgi:pimeloyl-ACP methyl ester carboxylesterase